LSDRAARRGGIPGPREAAQSDAGEPAARGADAAPATADAMDADAAAAAPSRRSPASDPAAAPAASTPPRRRRRFVF
jgi:hypothetical protein